MLDKNDPKVIFPATKSLGGCAIPPIKSVIVGSRTLPDLGAKSPSKHSVLTNSNSC